MCSYRPWWWWMASSRSCSSEGKSTSPHALHHESTLLMYCRGRNARWHLCKLPHRYKKFHETWHEAVWYTSLCSLQKSHASQSALEIALGALVSLNMQKCPFIWLWALKSFSEDFSWVCCLLACGDFQELSVPPYGMGGKQTNQHGRPQRNIRKLKWFNCCWY